MSVGEKDVFQTDQETPKNHGVVLDDVLFFQHHNAMVTWGVLPKMKVQQTISTDSW